MAVTKLRWWSLLVLVGAMLWSMTASADGGSEVQVAVTEVPDGGDEHVVEQVGEIAGISVMAHDDFVEEVQSRAFNPDTILDDPSDLEWVMDGGDIDVILEFEEESDEQFRVHVITAEDAQREHDFVADRDHDGAMGRGGAAVVRLELEQYLGAETDLVEAAIAEAGDDPQQPGQQDDQQTDRQHDEQTADVDPEALRREAAAEDAELREQLSRDWLWVRGHMRLFQNDFSAASQPAVYTYKSGGFFGYELDVEAFPFSASNPDLKSAGFYANFNHGLYSLTFVEENGEDEERHTAGVNNLTVEGGAIYRLDSPLDDSNRQLRLKLGGRYQAFMVSENPEIPSTAVASMVLGTRLVLPVAVEELAVTASADVAPLALFTTGAELFGEDVFSYGFGAELGLVYEVMERGFLSAGYTFRTMRSDFDGEGEPFGEGAGEVVFEDSEVFELSQGLRLGFVVQY